MQIISCALKETYLNKGEVDFIDFSLLGFKRSIDKKKVDFYYLFVTSTKEFAIVKESFLLDKDNIDDEMAYLNHPLHESIDMNKYSQFKKDSVKKLMERCNATNSFYSDFTAEEIINKDTAICKGIQYTLNNIQNVTKFIVPLSIYMRIQIIKNAVVFKLPIDVSIDSNIIYDNYSIREVEKTVYLGSENFKDKGFVNFYSLREKTTTTGIFLPVSGKSPKLVFDKEMTLSKFTSLYSKYFQIDLRNVLILDWVEDKKKKQILCIYKKTDVMEPVNYYLLDEDIRTSSILNPYNCFE